MDWLWDGHEVRAKDLKCLKFSASPLTDSNRRRHWTGNVWRIDSRAGLWTPPTQTQQNHHLRVTQHATFDDQDWNTWLDFQTLLDPSSAPPEGSLEEDRLSIVVSSPVRLTGYNGKLVEDDPIALRYTVIPEDLFLAVANKLHIHRGYFSLLEEGSPCAIKLASTVQNRPCEFYLLRTSNAVTSQSALAITHFPATHTQQPDGTMLTLGARTNVLVTGYTAGALDAFTTHLTRSSSSSLPSSPARFLVAFFEVEKHVRFASVRAAVREMQTVLHELAREPVTESPSARRKLHQTVDLYFVVHHLRTDGLVAWRDQLRLLRETTVAEGTNDEGGGLGRYLGQLAAQYEHRIGRCDMVLQGASLAYQMETTQLSRKDTEIAIGDGKTMKAIAVLTMVFLPGTFIATMLAVPQIEDALKPEKDASFGDEKWKWYLVLAIPVTVVAILAYAAWEFLYKRKYLQSLFDGPVAGGKDLESMEMESDLESGRGMPSV